MPNKEPLDTQFGFHALQADLKDIKETGNTASATAELKAYKDPVNVWVVPVALEKDEDDQTVKAAEWRPTASWEIRKRSFPLVRDAQTGELTSKVAFDFDTEPVAEGAAVLVVVKAGPGSEAYAAILSQAVAALIAMNEKTTADAVKAVISGMPELLAVQTTQPHESNQPQRTKAFATAAGFAGTFGTGSLTPLEALRKALQRSLHGSVMIKPAP